MPIYCNNCGHQNKNSVTFCQGCGEKIIATTLEGNLQTGVILNKNYEIRSLIKKGGMGAVYLAKDQRFDTECAVKEMLVNSTNPKDQKYMIESFKREAKILRNLRHPNIPVVLDYFTEVGRYYLVMDYINGKDLEAVMDTYFDKIVPEAIVIEWAKEILDALNYLHSQNPPIIYRDIKPGNIMLRSSDKKIILIDFGIARTITPGSQTLKTKIGTPEFAPKELFHGQSEVRSDIYSLGATIHCLLTGKVPLAPFEFKPVKFYNSKVSVGLEKIVMKALSMDLKDRYNSAKEMKEALLSLSSLSKEKVEQQSMNDNIGYSLHSFADSTQLKRDRSKNYIPLTIIGLGLFFLCIILVLLNSFSGKIDIKPIAESTSITITSDTVDPSSYIEPEMIKIKGGTFEMGSYNGKDNEKPLHKVTVSSFYIGKYEVTNKEYRMYDSSHRTGWSDDDHPVEEVSWYDSVKYCEWLSNKTGKNYRLPTEAEWEYACRAGSTTEYYWGIFMNDSYCWYIVSSRNDNFIYNSHPIGERLPNDWGLCDMSGNVSEWCSDWYGDYPSDSVTNPNGPSSGSYRVRRGGKWSDDADICRSAYRIIGSPNEGYNGNGFRLARNP